MELNGLALLCYENERPLQGLIGKLDWKFNGAFTKLLRKGVITGQKGELCYFPIKWNEETHHFLIFGSGENAHPGKRPRLTDTQANNIRKKATELGMTQVVIEGEADGI